MTLRAMGTALFIGACACAFAQADVSQDQGVERAKSLRLRAACGYGTSVQGPALSEGEPSSERHDVHTDSFGVWFGDATVLVKVKTGRIWGFDLPNAQRRALSQGPWDTSLAPPREKLERLATEYYHAAGETCSALLWEVTPSAEGTIELATSPVIEGHRLSRDAMDYMTIDARTGRLIELHRYHTVVTPVGSRTVTVKPEEVSARVAAAALARGTATSFVETEGPELIWWRPRCRKGECAHYEEHQRMAKNAEAILVYYVRFTDFSRRLPSGREDTGWWYDGYVDPATGELLLLYRFEDMLPYGVGGGTPAKSQAAPVAGWTWPSKPVTVLGAKGKGSLSRTDLEALAADPGADGKGAPLTLVDGKRYVRAEFWRAGRLLRVWTGGDQSGWYRASDRSAKRLAKLAGG